MSQTPAWGDQLGTVGDGVETPQKRLAAGARPSPGGGENGSARPTSLSTTLEGSALWSCSARERLMTLQAVRDACAKRRSGLPQSGQSTAGGGPTSSDGEQLGLQNRARPCSQRRSVGPLPVGSESPYDEGRCRDATRCGDRDSRWHLPGRPQLSRWRGALAGGDHVSRRRGNPRHLASDGRTVIRVWAIWSWCPTSTTATARTTRSTCALRSPLRRPRRRL